MLEQGALIALLGGEQRRPFLQVGEDEGVNRGRQPAQHLVVRSCERGGFAGEPRIELH